MNIFSGKNDIGKSNVLKVLDTFFNKKKIPFHDDYNKERLENVRKESVKGKQFIKITLELKNPGTYKTLPNTFTVSRTWDRDGNIIEEHRDNFETLIARGKLKQEGIKKARSSLTKFLNRIRFTYVPAIRDEQFFAYLLNKLQETIFEVEERKQSQKFQEKIEEFNQTISDLTITLHKEFEKISGISSRLSFPNNVSEIFQRLIIDTKSGEHDIPLRLRGDGIRLRYIPTIMNYISLHSKYNEIWGFDEPENSCEYSLSKKIAEQFSNEYSVKAQIFVSSHSFHFISITTPNTSKYRVYRKEGSLNTEIIQVDKANENTLSDELGILEINDKLAKLYETLSKELTLITETREKLAYVQKPFLIYEGETDNKLFRLAYEKLYNNPIDSNFFLNEHLKSAKGATIGSGANSINQFMYNHISKTHTNNPIIGIFDFDKGGFDEIKALAKQFVRVDKTIDKFLLYQHRTKKNVFVLTLVTPPHRDNFTDKNIAEYCYLSTELLLEDQVIPVANRHFPTRFETSVFSFTGNKNLFANEIESKKTDLDFEGFRPTFELINKIVKQLAVNDTN